MMIGKQHKLKKRSPHTQKLIKISVITLGSYNSILRLPTCVSTSKTNQSLEERRKKNLEMFQQKLQQQSRAIKKQHFRNRCHSTFV